MVLVQFRVNVPDVERFKATMSEWESHDAMMAVTDRFGDDFNRLVRRRRA